jgi:hypothetical protein
MRFTAWFSSWFRKKAFGEVLADFGELPSDLHNWRVCLRLRQIGCQPPYLQLKWTLCGDNRVWTSLACTPENFARLETIIRESRRHLDQYMAQRGASPDGGPAGSFASSGASEGPPSVS